VTTLVLLAAGLGWMLENRLSIQLAELSEKLPESLRRVRDYLAQSPWGDKLIEHMPQTAEKLAEIGQFTRMTGGLVAGVFGFLETTIVIIFVGIFGAAEPQLYRAGLLHLIPPQYRPRVAEAVDAVAYNLRWWLVGQVVLMIVIGITTTVMLWLVGIPLALTLGIIAGILELMPYIGPWLSAVPAVLVALLVSPWHVLIVLGIYLCLHIFEGYILLPLVQRRAVQLPPALTLLAQVFLGELLGLMGLFVAAPLTVTAIALIKMLYVKDALDDQAVRVPGEAEHSIRASDKSG
jgi:predicted PurR-regulated permease PerM